MGQIETARPGVRAMQEITIGQTGIEEVIAMFPLPNGKGEDGFYSWIFNSAQTRYDFDGNTQLPDQLLFYAEPDGLVCNYSILFTNGVATRIWFENISVMHGEGR